MFTEKLFFCLLPTLWSFALLLLTCTLLEPTACASKDILAKQFHNQRIHSDDALNDNQKQKIRRSADEERIQRRIKEIFSLDSDKDQLVLFNKTMLSPNFTFINHSNDDKTYSSMTNNNNDNNNNNENELNISRYQEQQFKVQRSPDGKLNLVVNDVIVYLQRPAQSQQPTATLINRDFVYPAEPQKGEGTGGVSRPDAVGTRLNLPEPPRCVESTSKSFCTKVANYPEIRRLEGLLKGELDKFEPFFGEDLPQPLNVSQRINGEPTEESLCDSHSRIIFPEAGKTRDNMDMYIVNSPTYKQGVRVEECQSEGKECKYSDSFPNGYKTMCKQHYIFRQLVALTREGTAIKQEFKLPSCCMCMVINKGLNF